MPWTKGDVEGHKKGLSDKAKEVWVKVANDALKRCKAKGQGNCEARAIKQANSVAGRLGEAWEQGFEEWFDEQDDETQGLIALHIHGLKSALESERELRREAERQPMEETLEGDFVPLLEKEARGDGVIPVKIISPGWGSSGYYSKDLLRRDGAKVFGRGTQMFWDHPTPTEESERPEGSLRNLAGELVSDARYEDGAAGPGLYADAKIFSRFRDSVRELAPHIGVSIRGKGKAKTGEIEGRKGPVIQEIVAAHSVDFVTMPGAGGQILSLFEAAREQTSTGGQDMEELKELQEAHKKLEGELAETEKAKADLEALVNKLREAALLREAVDFVSERLADVELPEMTKDRLVKRLSLNPPVKDGKIDEDEFGKTIDEAVKEDSEYLAKVVGSGLIKGMGVSGDTGGDEGATEKLEEAFKAKFEAQGISPEQAEAMAKTAARGR